MFREQLEKTAEYRRLAAGLASPGPAALFGLPPAGRAQVLAALAMGSGRPLVVVTAHEADAAHFAQDLSAFGLAVSVFPPRDLVLRPVEGTNREYEYRRLSVLGNVVGGRTDAVVLPVESFLSYTVPKGDFLAGTLTLKPGMEIAQKELTERLYRAGYQRRDRVEGPGQYSVRGGIVDFYAPDMEQPVRLEYWGDEIDSLSAFDLLSQRREETLKKVFLSPAREVLFASHTATRDALLAFAAGQKGKKRLALEKAMAAELEALEGGVFPENLDKFFRARYPRPGHILDYFQQPILALEEPGAVREAARAAAFRRGEEAEALLEEGALAPPLAELWPEPGLLQDSVRRNTSLLCENFARSLPEFALKDIVDAPAHALSPWNGELQLLLDDLGPLVRDRGYAVTVLAGTGKAAAGLARDLADHGFSATGARDAKAAPGVVQVLPGHLTAGCDYPFARYAVLTGRRAGEGPVRKKASRKAADALGSLADIKPGDYVVHQTHGIGIYRGIQRMELQGVTKDYLQIDYDKGDRLFVPVTQLDLLSRYSNAAAGEGEKTVRLSRLGGQEWQTARRKVKKATAEMAKELIQLYAQRRQARGFAFPADDDWQRDFETRFAYEETPDQLSSAAEIKHDMEKPWPMDRLLCGDVGVGKTEVALRAAFKCIMGGKQCALLAPTTLLAWQHYNTVLARMEGFPVKAALLNRFTSARQQRETLAGLASGTVDLVVGTHRLLSKDVRFADLGLVIVDEEQRFGVRHKEQLKSKFIGVDMLTLSATPIPRTLNMAMNGIRDFSKIDMPPYERRPVETYVLEYDEGILGAALRKELARGGQAYYLHNRVETIYRCAQKVEAMVPGARVGVAHGKMDEREISAVWQQLLDGELDVLVCTTLIETGVDVRNCNTLIIEDADRMGLAQLYQIRGRVGRSGRKAYAYFTFRRSKVLTEVAAKRLSAIREFTSFGSGFRIAMRDLQIRGAGSLLGHSQSGHMQAVGYDLYVKMLGQAVSAARGEPVQPDKSDCLVDVTVDAYLPESYLPDTEGRIEAYKRIAAIQNRQDAEDVIDELIDRYGDVPASVSSLVEISLIRVTAAGLGISEINQRRDTLLFYTKELAPETLRALLAACPGRVLYSPAGRAYASVKLADGENVLEGMKGVLAAWQGQNAGAV